MLRCFGRTEREDAWEMSDFSFPHSCFDRFLWVNESPIDHSKTILRNKGAAKSFSQRKSLLSDETWRIEVVPRKVPELQMGSLHPTPIACHTPRQGLHEIWRTIQISDFLYLFWNLTLRKETRNVGDISRKQIKELSHDLYGVHNFWKTQENLLDHRRIRDQLHEVN